MDYYYSLSSCFEYWMWKMTWNSPIVCTVLALDSWTYWSGEQSQQPNIHKIPQSSLYGWTMYIIIKIRCCHLMVNSLATRWHNHWEFHFLLISEAMHSKTLSRSCWAVRPALQSNSSQLYSANTTQTVGELIHSILGRAAAWQPNIHKTEYKSMFDTYQEKTYSLRPSPACCAESWCLSIVVM